MPPFRIQDYDISRAASDQVAELAFFRHYTQRETQAADAPPLSQLEIPHLVQTAIGRGDVECLQAGTAECTISWFARAE